MRHLLTIQLIYSLLFVSLYGATNNLLVVALMVKDEEAVIAATLEPFLKADPPGKFINYFIFDTGSTDATIQRAQELFDRYNITNYFILQEPFVDFSTSRNRALDLVEHYFPQTLFVLMPDAEWYINDVQGLLSYCMQEAGNINYGPYFIRIIDTQLDFFTPRLIRQSLHSRFQGVVHEALVVHAEQMPYTRLPATIFFEYKPTSSGRKKTNQRYYRDLKLLLAEYERNPNNTHTTFYLGQTYDCLGDWEHAYQFYSIRASQEGWSEDTFLAAYRRACMAHNLEKNNQLFTWNQVHEMYLQAYTLRPYRIEPLIKIAEHYLSTNNMALAFFYAKSSLDFPYPANDTNFVEKSMYDWQRYHIVGITAWYLGYYELGEWAVRKAIEAHPQEPQLYENLHYYMNRKLKKESEIREIRS